MTIKDEKDRLGQKLHDVEKAREDQYFAQKDRELLEKMRGSGKESDEEILRQVAKGRCPRCGVALSTKEMRNVSVDECSSCGGLWLDKGELETIAKSENEGWIARWLRYEFSPPK